MPTWVLIRIRTLNADPDPATQINADPLGSGSETLETKAADLLLIEGWVGCGHLSLLPGRHQQLEQTAAHERVRLETQTEYLQ